MYFCCNSGDTDLTDVCRKFYGHLNSILSVVGRCANEMAAVYLIKTYYLLILTYGCEALTLSARSLHTVGVVWNNCFRRILGVAGKRVQDPYSITVMFCHCHI